MVYQNLVGNFAALTPSSAGAADRGRAAILPTFAPDLSAYAHRALERLGRGGAARVRRDRLQLRRCGRGRPLDCCGRGSLAAGVAHRRRGMACRPADNAGRVKVAADLSIPDMPTSSSSATPRPSMSGTENRRPELAPPQATSVHVARPLSAGSLAIPSPGISLHAAGDLATIGKRSASSISAGASCGAGLPGGSGVAHIYFLIGLRNRLAVALSCYGFT